MTNTKEAIKIAVVSGVLVAIVSGVGIVAYDWYKGRTIFDAKLAYVGTKQSNRLLNESNNQKIMMYPIQIKIINTGNVPITITQVVPYHYIKVNGNALVAASLHNNTQSRYFDEDILPKNSKIIEVRAFIPEEIITKFSEVFLQAEVKIQGDKYPEKKASVFAYSVDSFGKPILLKKTRIISDFK